MDPLDVAVEAILDVCSPKYIFVYGPWARGVRDDGVMMDLLVVLEHARGTERIASRIIMELARRGINGEADVITSKTFMENIYTKYSNVYEAYHNGGVLYEA